MDPTYQAVAEFAQTWGLVYFVVIFAVVLRLRAVAVAQAAIRRSGAHSAAGGLSRWPTSTKKSIDVTGTATTGHEWDGIRELNTPLPRWWLWLFYVTIVWAVGYWIVYPAWPLLTTFTQGVFGWHSRSAVVDDLDGAQGAARRR